MSSGRILVIAAAAAVAATPGCGGDGDGARQDGAPLVWAAEPRLFSPPTAERAQILQGVVRNDSERRVEIEAREVTARERDGDEVRASPIFLSGYVRPADPQNRGPAQFSPQEAERLGRVARIAPGTTAPLVVSWRVRDGRPARIEYPGGSLPVPAR